MRRISIPWFVLPVAILPLLAVLSAYLFGYPLAWLTSNRWAYGKALGYGLPFVQFLAFAYLIDCFIRFVAERHSTWVSKRGVPKLAVQMATAFTYFVVLSTTVSEVFEQSLAGILAASGVLGIVLGMALRGLVADIFSGIALHLDPSLLIGDWIEVSNKGTPIFGRLTDIQWRATVITDDDENFVLIPNAELALGTITNRSRPDAPSRYWVAIDMESEADSYHVTKILENSLQRAMQDRFILTTPAPYVRLESYTSNRATFRLYFFVNLSVSSASKARNSVLICALEFLKASAAFRMGAPSFDVRRDLLHYRQYRVLSALRLFKGLPKQTCELLAQQLIEVPLDPQEVLLRAGDEGDTMMIIVEGGLDILIDKGEGSVVIAKLWPGDVVGEMSLFTGAHRTATVIANQRSFLYCLNKAAIAPLFRDKPLLVNHFAALIDDRKVSASARLNAQKDTMKEEAPDVGMVARIKKFFSL